jgi:hypothetical protein
MWTWLKIIGFTVFAIILVGILGPFLIFWYELVKNCGC